MRKAAVVPVLVLTLLGSIARSGFAKAQGGLSAEEILKKHIAAVGAADAKRASQSYKGTIKVQGLEGTIESYAKAPAKSYEKVDLKIVVQESGCDGQKAWRRDQGGLRELTGDELTRAREDAAFNRYLHFKDPKVFTSYKLDGTEDVDGKKAYKIELTKPSGGVHVAYFDANSFLELRRDYEAAVGKNRIKIQLYFDDYRKVNGVKLPFAIRQVTPFNEAVIKVASYSVNQAIPDSLFEMPKAEAPKDKPQG